MLFKKIALVAGLGLLVGCASQPAPQMQDHEYASIARGWVAWNRCISTGLLSPEIGAMGTRYIENDLSRVAFDSVRMDREVAKASAEVTEADKGFCNQMATLVTNQKQEIDLHNASIANQQQILQNSINNSPRQVYCNTVAGTTMCNGM